MKTLWLTHRAERHQKSAVQAAPAELEVEIRRDISPHELGNLLASTEILVSERSGLIDDTLLAKAPNLKLIVRLGSLDYDIDLEACHAWGVMVTRQPVVGAIQVAEHLVMVMLGLLKRLNESQSFALRADHGETPVQSDENTFRYNWNQLEGIGGLYDRSVGIVGMGEIGVELARRLRPFLPLEVLYNKRHPYPKTVEDALGVRFAPFEECCTQVDILVALLPYSQETRLILNKSIFEKMQKGALFIHAGSGRTVNESDLADSLANGHLRGASLDTYEWEPLQADNSLVIMARDPQKNIILTPHVAGGTIAANFREADYAEIRRFLAGEPLKHRVV